ncbi:MAG: class I SAM-dependent methyltransferase [Vicinamibacterales bacterium]
MKYGAIPSNWLERLALWTGQVPIPLLDCLFSLMKARALMAGVKLGIFEALREGPRAADDVALELKLDGACVDQLLRGLALMDYVAQKGERYELTALAKRTLVSGAAQELTGFVMWNFTQWEMIESLESLLQTGQGVDFHATMREPEQWGHYQQAMLELARLSAPLVARLVPVPTGARRLLDLGGGHGLFGAAICERHRPMTSTVLDLPAALPHGRRLAAAEGISDIVEHREADILTDDLGSHYDVALLSNILHHFRPSEIERILQRTGAALRSGATVAIWESEAPKKGSKVHFGDGVSLFFRLTSTAGAYHGDQYTAWLAAAGFSRIRARRPLSSPGDVLVTATWP